MFFSWLHPKGEGSIDPKAHAKFLGKHQEHFSILIKSDVEKGFSEVFQGSAIVPRGYLDLGDQGSTLPPGYIQA